MTSKSSHFPLSINGQQDWDKSVSDYGGDAVDDDDDYDVEIVALKVLVEIMTDEIDADQRYEVFR